MPPYPAALACAPDAARIGARLDRALMASTRPSGRVLGALRRLSVPVPVSRRVADSR